MREKQMDFLTLSEAVINELKGLGYMDSSLTNYRRLYRLVGSFMEERAVKIRRLLEKHSLTNTILVIITGAEWFL